MTLLMHGNEIRNEKLTDGGEETRRCVQVKGTEFADGIEIEDLHAPSPKLSIDSTLSELS
jgi:hypothetical protein